MSLISDELVALITPSKCNEQFIVEVPLLISSNGMKLNCTVEVVTVAPWAGALSWMDMVVMFPAGVVLTTKLLVALVPVLFAESLHEMNQV